MIRRLALFCTLSMAALAADIKTIVPQNGAKPVGPYSPGLLVGDYLYVSGQGASDASGKRPEGIEAQTRQCLNNVKAIVEAAGLTMDHTVYAQLYLSDISNYEKVNTIWPEYFKMLPARATLNVVRMPTDTPIEITVVVYKGQRSAITPANIRNRAPLSPGISTADRLYISGIMGRDSNSGKIPKTPEGQVQMVFDRLKKVLSEAKADAGNVAFVNIYRTSTIPAEMVDAAIAKFWKGGRPSIALLEVSALPFGANISVTGVAAKDKASLTRKGDCSSIGDTSFCSLAWAAGDGVETQTSATFAKLSLTDVVATNVYLDSIDEFARMNAKYAEAFKGKTLPTRTTVQPLKPGVAKEKFRFSFVAVQ